MVRLILNQIAPHFQEQATNLTIEFHERSRRNRRLGIQVVVNRGIVDSVVAPLALDTAQRRQAKIGAAFQHLHVALLLPLRKWIHGSTPGSWP